jgi:uncharacterized membrane protein
MIYLMMNLLKNKYFQASILPGIFFIIYLYSLVTTSWSHPLLGSIMLGEHIVFLIFLAILFFGYLGIVFVAKKIGHSRFLLMSSLTLGALVLSYILTYDHYCGWEGCSYGGGFPLPLFVPGGAGYGTSPNIFGIVVDSVLYFIIFYVIFKLRDKLRKPR